MAGSMETLVRPLSALLRNLGVDAVLEDATGGRLWESQPVIGQGAIRSLRETGLPCTIRVAASDPGTATRVFAARRRLLGGGFVLMVLVIAAASYFVFRAVNRELTVASLQSEFVAAVSHEFRSPLTAMRHLTEMLEEGTVEQERLPKYYLALGKETRRLQGMVENLLDFGRIEAGKQVYHLEETSATDLVRRVVDDFREGASGDADRVQVESTTDRFPLRADPHAMALALRNLLDNAVKYSPARSPITIRVEPINGLTGISVEDRGLGIPSEEQQEVFRKFVRGTSAKTLNVKGTGIGLAMADHIVRAHGGLLELDSRPGCGSKFTILLPVRPDQP